MNFTNYEEDYIKNQLDTDSIKNRAEAIYERRIESSRHYEYQPVFLTCGKFAGSRLIVEVDGDCITGIFLRSEVYI
jgi:hypothetical protein